MNTEMNMIFMIIFGIYLGILTLHLIIKARSAEDRRKNFYLSVAVFSGAYFICRIMLTINYFLSWDKYSDLYVWATFSVLVGFAGLMYSVEKFIYPKLKFIPTIGILVFAALTVIYPRTDGTNLVSYYTLAGGAFGLLVPLLYLYVGVKSAGALKKNSFIIAIGSLVFIAGKVLNWGTLQESINILYLVAPLLLIIGIIIFHYGIMKPVF
jgi:hypothetical protein